MMLDRGESQDWFSSTEIGIEAIAAGLFLYLFLVHTFTADRPFIEPAMFVDRNFAVGLVFIFVIGLILLSPLALLPPFLQNLLFYISEELRLVHVFVLSFLSLCSPFL